MFFLYQRGKMNRAYFVLVGMDVSTGIGLGVREQVYFNFGGGRRNCYCFFGG